ncbi:MAG: arsenical pump-driving ATPase [Candidatus Sulfopaludibacter sp.]|nr:arsenical pump-driving ATPase [Candidatus Sulfopaludibacter sp.]
MTDFLEQATRILFFTGKGGVGKTSLACAAAVSLAGQGKRVLLVSTDPASNLDEVLGVPLSGAPTPIPGAEGLSALNIEPEAAARAYRERVVGPYRGVLPDASIASMEEQLSGACTVEIAAFDEFTKLLGDAHATAGFHHIIFDTAPTGHTLRLLKLPAAWTGFIAGNTTGASCLGPLSGLETQRSLYDSSLKALTDSAVTTLFLVSRPERSALAEAHRSSGELAEIGVTNQRLLLNGIFVAHDRSDSAACALEDRGREALAGMPAGLANLPCAQVPLLPYAPMGMENLRRVFSGVPPVSRPEGRESPQKIQPDLPLSGLIDDLEKMRRGVVLTMGKGGVGKTTIASAIAVELARRGHPVHLSTTDPAAHVAATVGESVPNLSVSRIDPAAETRAYAQAVMAKAAPQLDPQGMALLAEDLRSPCTEEIAVFSAFARTVAEGERAFVILDTAPTGHTILLLDAAEAYHREVSRTVSDLPESVRRLLPRLRDPEFTRVLLVTLPEATPVHEAARLQSDLARAGIAPFAWVVNRSFAGNGFRDPVLRERGERELPFLTEVRERFARRMVVARWEPWEPVGPERLRQLAHAETVRG